MKPSTLDTYNRVLQARVLPTFKEQTITEINREAIQTFLAEKAGQYSKSTLRSMRAVVSLTMSWAKDCGWIPSNPCEGIRLPRITGGRKVTRYVLTDEQVARLSAKLPEPYATLVLFLATSGLRIGEAVGIKRSDFSGDTLRVTRRIYDRKEDEVKRAKSKRDLPLEPALVQRMLKLGSSEWVFESRNGTPVNPGNALKRYVRPAARELGISIGGWHDFRHTLDTTMRRDGVMPEVRAGVLGHSSVRLAMEVYDHPDTSDFEQPLSLVAGRLLQSVTKQRASA
jgi:integrase